MDVLLKSEINQQIQRDKAFRIKPSLIFIHKFNIQIFSSVNFLKEEQV